MAPKWSDLGPPTSGQVHWGETGPRNRFPLLPGRNSAKKGPKLPKFKKKKTYTSGYNPLVGLYFSHLL